MHPDVHSSIIYNSQGMETTETSINRGMDREYMVHIYNGILFSHKKKEVMPFVATWMDLEMTILSEASQKDKYHIISLYVELKFGTNALIDKTETDS